MGGVASDLRYEKGLDPRYVVKLGGVRALCQGLSGGNVETAMGERCA